MGAPATIDHDELDAYVEAYELRAASGPVDLAEFVPPADHPHFSEILCELIRVDLEYSWHAGVPRRVEAYLQRFPMLQGDTQALAAIAFEEMRQRLRAGERPSPAEYQERLGVAPESVEVPLPADPVEASAYEYLRQVKSTSKETAALTTAEPVDLPSTRLFEALHREQPAAARSLAEAVTQFPDVGATFAGFTLEAELGRGAFARVYLARQRELGGRAVALKLTADAGTESRAMAHLQHTNIAPVYSLIKQPPFEGLVMPYCGSATLLDATLTLRLAPALPEHGRWFTDLVRARSRGGPRSVEGGLLDQLSRLSYERAVVLLAVHLTAGLAHAHGRGVWHRDIKPANVLLADDGEPMLVDFNLAESPRWRDRAEAAHIGGTLPYMAPEVLAAFDAGQPLGDARADVYSLGLVLFELLTGRFPFPAVPEHELDIARLRADRLAGAMSLRDRRPHVSPALEAIVRMCLEPDPARRYPSARELHDDLRRQRDDRPLAHAPNPSRRERAAKWVRRHPRLASGYAVGAVAVALLLAVGGFAVERQWEASRLQRREADAAFQSDLTTASRMLAAPPRDPELLRRGLLAARRAADEQHAGRADYAAALLIAAGGERLAGQMAAGDAERAAHRAAAQAFNEKAEAATDRPGMRRAIWWQRAALTGDDTWRRRAMNLPADPQGEWWAGVAPDDDAREVVRLLEAARPKEPGRLAIWRALGHCYLELGRADRAVAYFETARALAPELSVTALDLGNAQHAAGDYPAAIAAYDTALRLDADLLGVRADRALSRFKVGDTPGALEDLDVAIDRGFAQPRVYFIRARIRAAAGDPAGALRDRADGFRHPPITEEDWGARVIARLPDGQAALAEIEHGLTVLPKSRLLREQAAHVLSEVLHRTDEAVEALDQLVKLFPESAHNYAGRAVLHARAGRDDQARRDAETALRLTDRPADRPDVVYQVAGVFALLSQRHPAERDRAVFYLADALHRGYGRDFVATDPDLEPIRGLPEVRKLVEAVRAWK